MRGPNDSPTSVADEVKTICPPSPTLPPSPTRTVIPSPVFDDFEEIQVEVEQEQEKKKEKIAPTETRRPTARRTWTPVTIKTKKENEQQDYQEKRQKTTETTETT